MRSTSNIDLEIKGSVYDPDSTSREIQIRNQESDSPLYHVYIYLEGQYLPFVVSVTYQLHKSFENPIQKVTRSVQNQNCKLEIWTWGLFDVLATVVDNNGEEHKLSLYLDYDKELSNIKKKADYELL